MPELTLPVFTPLMILKTMGTGANEPVLMRAVDRSGVKSDVVVKLISSERMDADRSMRELVGSFMALHIGLNAPAPCLTLIDATTAELAHTAKLKQRLTDSQGLNFSSLNIEDLVLRVKSDTLSKNLRSDALKVFVFDLLIQNPDRTIGPGGKTNFFTTGDDLWVLDHELAFSYLDLIFPPAEPWVFTAADLDGFIKKHVLDTP